MTSEEIKATMPYEWSPSNGNSFWLKEIAYQLALAHEYEVIRDRNATAAFEKLNPGWLPRENQ